MNTQHLQYLIEIERTRSVSQAAENLFIGQPNLSRILHEMEANLGFKIFERTSKGVRSTERGAIFLQHAKSIIRELERIDALELADDALGVLQKNRAALGRANALAGPLKNFEAKVCFHLMQNAAEVGLADEQIFRSLGNGAGSFYFNQILQMLRIHSISPII